MKLFLTVCLMAMVTTASAQFANSDAASGKSKSGSGLVKDTDPYNRIYVSYSPIGGDIKMTGFSLGYLHGFNLSRNLPMFLEVGGNVAYSFGDQKYPIIGKIEYNAFSVNVPVNFAYKLTFGKSGCSLTPFLGINLRYNISSKVKTKKINSADFMGGDYGDYWDYLDGYEDYGDYGYEDILDEFGYGDPGLVIPSEMKDFQVGWQVGVGFNYKKLYVGVSYGSDFSEIAKNMKAHTTQISLGLNF